MNFELLEHTETLREVCMTHRSHLMDTREWLRQGKPVVFVNESGYWETCLPAGRNGDDFETWQLTSVMMRTGRVILKEHGALVAPISEIAAARGKHATLMCHSCKKLQPLDQCKVCTACSFGVCLTNCLVADTGDHSEVCKVNQTACEMIYRAAKERVTYPLVNCVFRSELDGALCRLPIPISLAVRPPLLPTDVLDKTSEASACNLVRNNQYVRAVLLKEMALAEASRHLSSTSARHLRCRRA